MGVATTEAVGKIRSGIEFYRVVVLINLVGAAVGGVVAVATGIPALPSILGGSSPSASATAGIPPAYSAGLGLLSLAALILIILSWVRWRSGVKALPGEAPAFGPAHAEEARRAERDYGRTVWTFVLGILVTVVVAAIVIAILIASAIGSLVANNTTAPRHALAIGNLAEGILLTIVGIAIVGYLINLLMYYFASRSLRESIFSLSRPEQQARLDQGARLILIGAALSILPLAEFGFSYLAFLGLVPGIVLFLGFTEMLRAYREWTPPAPPTGPIAPPSVPLGSPYRP